MSKQAHPNRRTIVFTARRTITLCAWLVLLPVPVLAADAEPSATIPWPAVDADANAVTVLETEKYHRQELRVGGRLERVTVTRRNGVTEIYQNHRADTVWVSEEAELGDIRNMRQWKIGSW